MYKHDQIYKFCQSLRWVNSLLEVVVFENVGKKLLTHLMSGLESEFSPVFPVQLKFSVGCKTQHPSNYRHNLLVCMYPFWQVTKWNSRHFKFFFTCSGFACLSILTWTFINVHCHWHLSQLQHGVTYSTLDCTIRISITIEHSGHFIPKPMTTTAIIEVCFHIIPLTAFDM